MKNNIESSRFELEVNGQIVFAEYRRDADVLTIDYVEAPVELRGTGAAAKLMTEIAEMAKKEKLQIVPICGYAAAWLKRSQYRNLLA